ncbi:DUF305 domain-containing protein [Micromonospora sp. NPDC050686]|uniref:DUF305 domain-containing protein n=1 Tax=Micromonospora sp. NPDC050686 TaxID=3154631 RepID=UPI0033F5802C
MVLSRRLVLAAGAAAVAVGVGSFAAVQLTGGEPDQPPRPAAADRIVQPGAPGQSGRSLSPEELASIAPPEHKAADRRFFQQMIPHHAQALEMTALLAGRTTNPDVTMLAKRIDASQTEEIKLMEQWLTERGEPTPAAHAGHDRPMPGMLTDEQFAQLKAARGAAFDRLFLESMIRHHEGALTMVRELYASGGGVESASDRFARDVDADQSIEIQRMRGMLAKMR